jgi:xylulokinase
MPKPSILVIDVGTTNLKTGLFDFTCRPVDHGSSPHNAGGVDPVTAVDRLWSMVEESVPALTGRNPDYRVSAVGLTGFMHSVLALDRDGKVLPFLAAEEEVRRCFDKLVDHFGVDKIYQTTGSRLDVTSVPPQVLAWRTGSQREFERISSLLPVKDLLRYRLTGEIGTDEIDACGTMFINLPQHCWDSALISYCGLDISALPPVLHCTERAGVLSSGAAARLGLAKGIPVAVGAGDDIEALGSGVRSPRQVCEHVGSTGSFLLPLRAEQSDPTHRLELYPAVTRGEWVLGGSCSNVARALDWFLTSSSYGGAGAISWGRARAELAEAVAEITSDRPLFLPYLYGERAPLWNPDLRAQWVGLRNTHRASDLLLSVVEGICFSLRNVLEAYRDLDLDIDVVCSSGGFNQLGAQQLRATIYGKPLRLVRGTDPTSFGTAAITLCAIGELRDPTDAMDWLEFEPDLEPESTWKAALDERFLSFVELTQKMADYSTGVKPASRAITQRNGQKTRC